MTIEELSAYLHHHFPRHPDEVQQVLIDCIEAKMVIRFPKTWTFRRMRWRILDEQLKNARHNSLIWDNPSLLQSRSDNPLTRAEHRETIKRFIKGLTNHPRNGTSQWARWGYKEDLKELLDPKPPEASSG